MGAFRFPFVDILYIDTGGGAAPGVAPYRIKRKASSTTRTLVDLFDEAECACPMASSTVTTAALWDGTATPSVPQPRIARRAVGSGRGGGVSKWHHRPLSLRPTARGRGLTPGDARSAQSTADPFAPQRPPDLGAYTDAHHRHSDPLRVDKEARETAVAHTSPGI